MKSCKECVNAIFDDYGYSNWTTEGTSFYCMKKLHPADGFDRFYYEDEKNEVAYSFAEKCSEFIFGKPVKMDCDKDNESELEEPQKSIYRNWLGI